MIVEDCYDGILKREIVTLSFDVETVGADVDEAIVCPAKLWESGVGIDIFERLGSWAKLAGSWVYVGAESHRHVE